MNFNSLFSERLKTERKRLGLSQAAAGEVVGVSREMWGKYERGAMPGVDVLAALSASGADVLYILTGQRSSHLELELSPEEEVLLDNYRAIPAERKFSLIDVASALASVHGDKKEAG